MKFFRYSKNNESVHIGPKWFRISVFIQEKLIRIKAGKKTIHLGKW